MISRMPQKIIEAALKSIWEKIEFIKREKNYGSIEVIMESSKVVRLNSINPIKKDEVTLIPTYMGRRMTKIKVPKILPKANPNNVVVAVLKNINNRMEIIKVKMEEKQHWQDKTVNLWIQVESEVLSGIPETFDNRGGKKLRFLWRDVSPDTSVMESWTT